jgi:ElaA protein
MEIEWKIKHFVDLNKYELYDLFALRTEIFVVEQHCPYLELDGKDKHSFHVLGEKNGKIIAVARILPPKLHFDNVSIGRVCVAINERKKNIATEMMQEIMSFIGNEFGKVDVQIHAQTYLEKFYSSFKFKTTSKPFLEDNIEHIEMIYSPFNT